MPKVKLTKNELKAQRDALRRFERYLPTLALKKAQLQLELRQVEQRIDEKSAEETRIKDALAPWVRLFSEAFPFAEHLRIERLVRGAGNVAGVTVPTLEDVVFERRPVDLIASPPWVDDGLPVLEQIMRVRMALVVLAEQRALIADELRATSQRVNLFERVKIPECRESIRRIRIALGDQQTIAVTRGKIAKRRLVAHEAEA